ncbi:TetR/AcrR family transcriptional regulator [Brevibacillus nitrificans]|uniref:TetR/AcrR family transcriptional regulator n=1 Tax=Brevibacillus nitrificans TaxID=651560 RepID=UPI00260D1B02|nr:TetR/AcrR family transcriptional regulator [Brevibacillus nitrificans]MED1792187.1 helix-turn-helix domain containing protein [Brevibacillus nitrificans]
MAPLNEEQLHQIRDERREQIMRAALKVFARRGIIGTKMSMIAAEAGISHGLLYHYFSSKEELFTTLIEDAMKGAEEATSGVYDLPGTPLEKIRALSVEMLDESGTPYFMLIHHARTSDGVPEKVKELIARHDMHAFIARLLPVFREAQQAGEIVEGSLEELISSYLSVLSGLMVLNAQGIEGYRLPDVDMLLRLIAKSRP